MAINIQRYLQISLLQGGADTFVQGSVATDIIPENGVAYKIISAEFAFTSALYTIAADFFATWSWTRDTKTSVATFADSDTMIWDGFSLPLTTSGMPFVPQLFRYQNLDGIYVVEPTIYASFNTGGGAAAYQAYARLYYEEVKLSEVEILRILNNT